MSSFKLYEHSYNLRKKRNRNKNFDLLRQQEVFPSPHQRHGQGGINHKKDKLVEPKSRRKLNREEVQRKMGPTNEDRLPTANEIFDDIDRIRNGPPLAGQLDCSSSPLAGFRNGNDNSRGAQGISETELNKKIAETVSRTIIDSQKQFEARMMNMMTTLLGKLILIKVLKTLGLEIVFQ